MISESIHIRKATMADVDDLFRLEQVCFDAESFSRRQINYLVSQAVGGFLVLIENEIIAGFLVFLKRKNSNGLRLYSLAISPEFRGKNYAKLLLKKAVDIAKETQKSYLYLEVSENNPTAIKLYQKIGFQLSGKRKAYYKDGSTALLMRFLVR